MMHNKNEVIQTQTAGRPLSRQCEIPHGSGHSAALGMLSVTDIMPVLVLLSVVG